MLSSVWPLLKSDANGALKESGFHSCRDDGGHPEKFKTNGFLRNC
jgi:hypothetical protein